MCCCDLRLKRPPLDTQSLVTMAHLRLEKDPLVPYKPVFFKRSKNMVPKG